MLLVDLSYNDSCHYHELAVLRLEEYWRDTAGRSVKQFIFSSATSCAKLYITICNVYHCNTMLTSLFQKLKKDVAEQRTLAYTIMKDGEALVKCMAVNSSGKTC